MARKKLTSNSTKGKAVMDPRSYKGDALVQVWMDSRRIATLSNWLDNNGYVTRTIADVLKFTVEMIVEKLVDGGQVEFIDLTKTARELLDKKYKSKLNPSGRGERNLLHNLILDERRSGSVESRDDMQVSEGSKLVDRLAKQAMETYRDQVGEKSGEQLTKEAKVGTDKLKSLGLTTNVDAPRKLTQEELEEKVRVLEAREREITNMGEIPREGIVSLTKEDE